MGGTAGRPGRRVEREHRAALSRPPRLASLCVESRQHTHGRNGKDAGQRRKAQQRPQRRRRAAGAASELSLA